MMCSSFLLIAGTPIAAVTRLQASHVFAGMSNLLFVGRECGQAGNLGSNSNNGPR